MAREAIYRYLHELLDSHGDEVHHDHYYTDSDNHRDAFVTHNMTAMDFHGNETLDADLHHDTSSIGSSMSNSSKPWGLVMGAALIVQLVTLSGLVAVVLVTSVAWIKRMTQNQASIEKTNNGDNDSESRNARMTAYILNFVIPSCAAGALLATTVFLITPEALVLIQSPSDSSHDDHGNGHDDEEAAPAWKFGVAVMTGILFPIVLGALFERPPPEECAVAACGSLSQTPQPLLSDHDNDNLNEILDSASKPSSTAELDSENGNESSPLPDMVEQKHTPNEPEDCDDCECGEMLDECTANERATAAITTNATTGHRYNIPLAVSLVTGDFLHNISDGFFIGTAFLLCDASLAWTIVASTIYHELCQELADYMLLTHYCGLSMLQALSLNFLSGSSVWLGALIVLSMDLSNGAIGWILSISAGVYLHIAVSECLPRIQAIRQTTFDTAIFLLCFTVGAVPIGLVLLNHGHCDAPASADLPTAVGDMAATAATAMDTTGHDDHGHRYW